MLTCQLAIDDPIMKDEIDELINLLMVCIDKLELLSEDMQPCSVELNQAHFFANEALFIVEDVRNSINED